MNYTFEEALKLSKEGNVLAKFHLGLYYFGGFGQVKINYIKSRRYFTKSMKKGFLPSYIWLWHMYSDKTACTKTDKKYSNSLLKSAIDLGIMNKDLNNPIVQHCIGLIYEDRDMVFKMFEMYKKSADQNYAPALYELGYFYNDNDNNNDNEKSLKYHLQAAKQNYAHSQNEVAEIYIHDKKKSYEYYLKSANQGSDLACFNIGRMYEDGDYYFTRDINKAIEWYKKGLCNAYYYSCYGLASLYYDQEKYKEAFYLFQKVANNGDDDSQYEIGRMYKYGIGVKKNNKKAIKWLSESANNDNSDAPLKLIDFYRAQKDYNNALKWLFNTYESCGEFTFNLKFRFGNIVQDVEFEENIDNINIEYLGSIHKHRKLIIHSAITKNMETDTIFESVKNKIETYVQDIKKRLKDVIKHFDLIPIILSHLI